MGPQGPAGAPALVSITVRTASVTGTNKTVSVSCLAGEKALGGGGQDTGLDNPIRQSVPLVGAAVAVSGQTPNGWRATFTSNPGSGDALEAYVICAG
jgi:hypothetical protein